jgi:predicted lipid-binding transport protein (Tim44 family)
MGYIDIAIYAVVAALLIARLWAVFGRRNDEDRERPNPFAPPPHEDEGAVMLPGRARPDAAMDAASSPFTPLRVAPGSLMGGLEKIKELDPSFDEKRFLQAAKQSFSMIVADFAKGDLTDSAKFLSPAIADHFKKAIAERAKAGHMLENKIARIRDADVAATKIDGTRAILTVRIESEQENVLRDDKGAVLSGQPGRTEEISDVWTFARDTKSADPTWQLIETRTA